MNSRPVTGVLLSLDAGVRESGWAIFGSGDSVTTGVVGTRGKRGMGAEVRLSRLVRCLDLLVDRWRPNLVAHSLPSGIHWPVPALDLLSDHLAQWSRRHGLPIYAYTAQEVRAAITGHPNASRDQLAYEVMAILQLIGHSKTTHEWEALAVGHSHLSLQSAGEGAPKGNIAQD